MFKIFTMCFALGTFCQAFSSCEEFDLCGYARECCRDEDSVREALGILEVSLKNYNKIPDVVFDRKGMHELFSGGNLTKESQKARDDFLEILKDYAQAPTQESLPTFIRRTADVISLLRRESEAKRIPEDENTREDMEIMDIGRDLVVVFILERTVKNGLKEKDLKAVKYYAECYPNSGLLRRLVYNRLGALGADVSDIRLPAEPVVPEKPAVPERKESCCNIF